MAATPSAERRVGQLRNDVNDIYELIGVVQSDVSEIKLEVAQHGEILAQHSGILAQHSGTLAAHGETLAEHGGKLDHIIEILESRAS